MKRAGFRKRWQSQLRAALRELQRFDWSELREPELIGVWPAPVKALLLLLLFVASLAAGHVLLLGGRRAELQAAPLAQQELQSELSLKAQLAAGLAQQRLQVSALQRELAASLKQFPVRSAVPDLLDDIGRSGQGSGVQLSSIQLQPERPQDFYHELPIELVVSGHYHAFGSFLAELVALPSLLTVHDFSIERPSVAALPELRLQLRSYSTVVPEVEWQSLVAAGQDGERGAGVRHRAQLQPGYSVAALRSPFDASPEQQGRQPAGRSSLQPDFARLPEALEQHALTELAMAGTLARGGRIWALVRDSSGTVSRVTTGNYLGRQHGRIVAVSEARIELLELVPDEAGGWVQRPQRLDLQP